MKITSMQLMRNKFGTQPPDVCVTYAWDDDSEEHVARLRFHGSNLTFDHHEDAAPFLSPLS